MYSLAGRCWARYLLLIIPGSRHAIPTAYTCCTLLVTRSTVQDGTRKGLARAATTRAALLSLQTTGDCQPDTPDGLSLAQYDSACQDVELELPSRDDDMSVAYAPAPAHVFRPRRQPGLLRNSSAGGQGYDKTSGSGRVGSTCVCVRVALNEEDTPNVCVGPAPSLQFSTEQSM